MGTLHLSGTLDLSGSLTLSGKVLIEGKEALVALAATPLLRHSDDGVPPDPSSGDITKTYIWASASAAVHVQIIDKLVVVNGAPCIQGAIQTQGKVRATSVKVTIDGAVVAVEKVWAEMPNASVMLTDSGQPK